VRKPEGMQPLERISCGWEDNIKVGPGGGVCGDVIPVSNENLK
jgi:hypothetical protein